MKIGRDPERDRHRIAIPREAMGDGVQLMVDANGAYRRKQALAWADVFAQRGGSWLEEPVSSDDVAGPALVGDRATARRRGWPSPPASTCGARSTRSGCWTPSTSCRWMSRAAAGGRAPRASTPPRA